MSGKGATSCSLPFLRLDFIVIVKLMIETLEFYIRAHSLWTLV